jgi:hypothetical protein
LQLITAKSDYVVHYAAVSTIFHLSEVGRIVLVSRTEHPGQKGRQSALAFAFYALTLTIGFLPDFFPFWGDTPITYQPCGSLAFQSSRVVARPIVSGKQTVRRVNTCVLLNSNVHFFVASSDQVVTVVLLFNTIIIEWDVLY